MTDARYVEYFGAENCKTRISIPPDGFCNECGITEILKKQVWVSLKMKRNENISSNNLYSNLLDMFAFCIYLVVTIDKYCTLSFLRV